MYIRDQRILMQLQVVLFMAELYIATNGDSKQNTYMYICTYMYNTYILEER